MPTINNGHILLYCHFNKIIKGCETSFQSPALSQKHIGHVCIQYTSISPNFILIVLRIKKNRHKWNFRYVAMPTVMSQILKSVGFTKTQKPRYLENKTLFFLQIKKFINYTSMATL